MMSRVALIWGHLNRLSHTLIPLLAIPSLLTEELVAEVWIHEIVVEVLTPRPPLHPTASRPYMPSQLMEEESAEVWIQEALITELTHRAATGMVTKGAEAVAATAAAAAAAAAASPSAPLLSVVAEILRDRPAGGRRAAKSAAEMAEDAGEKLERCRLAAEGPPRCKVRGGSVGGGQQCMCVWGGRGRC